MVRLSSWLLLPLFCMAISCNDSLESPDKELAFYLVSDYQLLENEGYNRIDESTVKVDRDPLIGYSNIVTYDPGEYFFELTGEAVKIIEELDQGLYGKPFAVMIDGDLIYTAYFWPSYFSSSCDWVVVDPIMADFYHGIKLRLGYPGLIDGEIIPDKRNDSRIIELLRRDNKLKN